MTTNTDCACAVVLPHLYVQNANAVSSPMTWGFPAMSAFAGFAHALERKLRAEGADVYLHGVAVVCHKAEPLLVDGPSYAPRSFRLTRNPLDQTGSTSAIVEEGRMHLSISVVITVSGPDAPRQDNDDAQAFATSLMNLAMSMRIAGGSVVPPGIGLRKPRMARAFIWNSGSKEAVQQKLMRMLMPGFALIGRAEVLAEHLSEMRKAKSDASALDALLDLCALHIDPAEEANKDGKFSWTAKRRRPGFLVPIPMGFAAISEVYEPGVVKNARDASVPFRFVESVLSLGEWRSPHRITDLDDMLWRFAAQPESGTYLITNSQAN
jgi:CRISPR-associated protein Csy2